MAKETQPIDPNVFVKGDQMCDGYYMGDPAITRAMAQQAAIQAMQGSRQLDQNYGTRFAQDQFALDRLKNLGVDPLTLKIKPANS